MSFPGWFLEYCHSQEKAVLSRTPWREEKVLDVTFTDGLVVAGSNTVEVTGEKDITIADIEDALFGTWSGTFNYTAGIVDAE